MPGDGWVALGAEDLNFRASRTNRSFDGHYFNAGSATPGGSAIVLRNGGQLAVAFRGTDDPIDYLSYTKIANGTYLDGFNSFLTCVATYAKANKITDVLVTGHSLGAGAANILRDCPPDKYGGVFHNADYVTFATPKVAASGDILNIGFENDYVFKILNKRIFLQRPTTSSCMMTSMQTRPIQMTELSTASRQPRAPWIELSPRPSTTK